MAIRSVPVVRTAIAIFEKFGFTTEADTARLIAVSGCERLTTTTAHNVYCVYPRKYFARFLNSGTLSTGEPSPRFDTPKIRRLLLRAGSWSW